MLVCIFWHKSPNGIGKFKKIFCISSTWASCIKNLFSYVFQRRRTKVVRIVTRSNVEQNTEWLSCRIFWIKNDCCSSVASFLSEVKVCFYFLFFSYWQFVSNTPYTALLKNGKNYGFVFIRLSKQGKIHYDLGYFVVLEGNGILFPSTSKGQMANN